MCSICSKSIFSDLVWFIYCIACVESNHSSYRVFGLRKIVQNQFSSDLIRFMYILNRIIQALVCLAHENWFWIYSIIIWNHLNWFKVSMIILNLHGTRISYFTQLNQFKTFLIRLNPIFFLCYFGPTYWSISLTYIYISIHSFSHL